MAGKSWSCFENHDHGRKITVPVLKITTMAGKSWSCFENHDHGWKIMVLFRKSRPWLENHGPVSKITTMVGKSWSCFENHMAEKSRSCFENYGHGWKVMVVVLGSA